MTAPLWTPGVWSKLTDALRYAEQCLGCASTSRFVEDEEDQMMVFAVGPKVRVVMAVPRERSFARNDVLGVAYAIRMATDKFLSLDEAGRRG